MRIAEWRGTAPISSSALRSAPRWINSWIMSRCAVGAQARSSGLSPQPARLIAGVDCVGVIADVLLDFRDLPPLLLGQSIAARGGAQQADEQESDGSLADDCRRPSKRWPDTLLQVQMAKVRYAPVFFDPHEGRLKRVAGRACTSSR